MIAMEKQIKHTENHQKETNSLIEKLTEDHKKLSRQVTQVEVVTESTRDELNATVINKMATKTALADMHETIMESLHQKLKQLQIELSKAPETITTTTSPKEILFLQESLGSLDKRLCQLEDNINITPKTKTINESQQEELQRIAELSNTVDVLMNRVETAEKKCTDALTEFSM